MIARPDTSHATTLLVPSTSTTERSSGLETSLASISVNHSPPDDSVTTTQCVSARPASTLPNVRGRQVSVSSQPQRS
ncbi:MAG: hypothetical protein J2P19_22305, partial [Pseudonocardia sp.]|nr:hypothetical protein [Pseudonocardia sp.]